MHTGIYFCFVLHGLLATQQYLSHEIADFNADGRMDAVEVRNAKFDDNGLLLSKTISVDLGGIRKIVYEDVPTATGNISVYAGLPSDLIIDYSNRSSRDSAELVYDIYTWSMPRRSLCLKASVTGVPPNQLRGEIIPSEVEVERFSGCNHPGDAVSPKALSKTEATASISREMEKASGNRPIPEYYAFELASIITKENVTAINNVAYSQEQRGFLIPALIILESVHRKFPGRLVATINLADTYWKLSKKSEACRLYRLYNTMLKSRKQGRAPERVRVRSACPR